MKNVIDNFLDVIVDTYGCKKKKFTYKDLVNLAYKYSKNDNKLNKRGRPKKEENCLPKKCCWEVIMHYYKTKLDVTHKSPNNPVTKADYEANEKIKEILTLKYPDFGWLSEETKDSSERLKKEYVWIIDPIDGTKEFIEGIPNFSISIGLVQNGIPILGVLYNPASEELFYAKKNQGSFYNDKLVKCSLKKNISLYVSQ